METFDPFTATKSIPRGDSAEEINLITSPKQKVKDSKITMATSGTSGEVYPIYPIQSIPLKDALTVVPEYNGENIP